MWESKRDMKKWSGNVKKTFKEEGIRKTISLSANNHTGFDPATVSIFSKTAISLAISAILILSIVTSIGFVVYNDDIARGALSAPSTAISGGNNNNNIKTTKNP
jgi:hypothetical protein